VDGSSCLQEFWSKGQSDSTIIPANFMDLQTDQLNKQRIVTRPEFSPQCFLVIREFRE